MPVAAAIHAVVQGYHLYRRNGGCIKPTQQVTRHGGLGNVQHMHDMAAARRVRPPAILCCTTKDVHICGAATAVQERAT
jgi:hypothetical protein